MHHIQGCERDQTLLLPNSVADYIGPDNPVRFVEAFVDQLDLQEAGFCRVEPKETGRPGYDPTDLLKLYIYGYLNRVRSSRRLEAETRRNLEVIAACEAAGIEAYVPRGHRGRQLRCGHAAHNGLLDRHFAADQPGEARGQHVLLLFGLLKANPSMISWSSGNNLRSSLSFRSLRTKPARPLFR